MSYFLLGSPYKVFLETRACIHGTLQNTPKASSLMLTPGWRGVCGGNDIWVGPWKTEDVNKKAGPNLSACWHLPTTWGGFLVAEENWLEYLNVLRGFQGSLLSSGHLPTISQSLLCVSSSQTIFFHLCLPHITPTLSFSKHPWHKAA